MHEDLPAPDAITRGGLAPLAVGALGVVYGDIGTSPLYATKEIFIGPYPLAVTPDNVLGILSLLFWSLRRIKTAFVRRELSEDDLFYENVAVNRGFSLRGFDKCEEAVEWLTQR